MGCWGDPGTFINVNNSTSVKVSFYIQGVNHGEVPPGETKEIGTLEIWPEPNQPGGTEDYKYLIEAKTEQGAILYSKDFTWNELDDMHWKIVILPLGNHSESSGNITGT
jgi:hypothetical protein